MDIAKTALTGNKVLIIEDDLATGAMLEDMLREEGFVTRHVVKGREGVEAVKQWQPGVILLDLILPDMNGCEVCGSIRGLELPERLSIIIVSVREDKETVAEALAMGADDFVVKPVDALELVARIKAQFRIGGFCREIEEDKRNLETIVEITDALSATLDSSEVLDIIVRKVAVVTDAARCSIVLVMDGEGYVLASSDNPDIKKLRIDLGKYPEIREVVNTRKPLIMEDMTNHPLMKDVRGLIKKLEGMSMLVVPIVINDEVVGTLYLRARRVEGGFARKEIDFCQIVANASYNAIKNASLFEKATREKEQLKEMAITDQLTTLYNHNFFYLRLDDEFERAVRYKTPVSLIMMDIDNFKQINDRRGHRTGDTVLKEIAKITKRTVRKTDVVARYGGEEFVVILPTTPLEGASKEAERIRWVIEECSSAGLIGEVITVSLGVATYPDKGIMNSGDLVNRADNALYRAKQAGKNCVRTVGG
jgi:two-component system cell cycle response regulator